MDAPPNAASGSTPLGVYARRLPQPDREIFARDLMLFCLRHGMTVHLDDDRARHPRASIPLTRALRVLAAVLISPTLTLPMMRGACLVEQYVIEAAPPVGFRVTEFQVCGVRYCIERYVLVSGQRARTSRVCTTAQGLYISAPEPEEEGVKP